MSTQPSNTQTPSRSDQRVHTPDERVDSLTELDKPSWLGVLRRSLRGFKTDNLSDWAAALTYRGVLCLAPGLLILVAILGLLGKSTTDTLLANVGDLAPSGVRSVLEQVVHNVQSSKSAGFAGVIGLVIAVWSASSYVAAFMRASNAIYEVGEGRPVWKTVPVRLGVTLIMLVLLVISAAIVVFSGPLADKLGQAIGVGHTAVTVFGIVKWPVLIVIVSLMLAILYYACPNVKQSGVQWISPGGVLAVIIWIVVSGLFAVYVANFGSYNKTYGTLASVVVFMVWLWLTNLAILLGAEFNAELQHARAIKSGAPEDSGSFAEPRDTRKLDDEATAQATALSPKQTAR
ncbi:MAG TPA: YihY/virulence factor BrkB family protein [Jatrophihabitantaceae bacterium]|nr:YihY/virulence factor BrkB family protein [Jatrophihabitantaceae bacterium]